MFGINGETQKWPGYSRAIWIVWGRADWAGAAIDCWV